MTQQSLARTECPHCGQHFRTGGTGLKWHLQHMHPAAVASLTGKADPEYAAIQDKGERYRYEITLAAVLLAPCPGCGTPTKEGDACGKCMAKQHRAMGSTPHSTDPANRAYENAKREQMRSINPHFQKSQRQAAKAAQSW